MSLNLPPSLTNPSAVPAAAIPVAAVVAAPPVRRRPIRTMARHFWRLELWKKSLLVLAIALFAVGVAGSITGGVRTKPAAQIEARQTVETLNVASRHSSLTSDQQQTLNNAKQTVSDTSHWFYDKVAPRLWRIGLGFSIAFVLGYMARQFVKTVATLLAIVLIGAGVAVYLGHMDGNKVGADLKSGAGWVAERTDWMKSEMLAVATASVSGTIGFVIGFVRKRS